MTDLAAKLAALPRPADLEREERAHGETIDQQAVVQARLSALKEVLNMIKKHRANWGTNPVGKGYLKVIENVAAIEDRVSAMIAALPRPAGGEDAVLPHDVTVGAVTFRKGVALSTLINAAERWHTAAMAVQPGPDVEAVQEAIESLPRPAVDEGATTRVVEAARRLADHMRSSTWVGPALDQDPSKEARLFRELHAALAALAAAQEGDHA